MATSERAVLQARARFSAALSSGGEASREEQLAKLELPVAYERGTGKRTRQGKVQ